MLRNIFILLIISLTLGSCQKKSDQQIEPQNGITKFNPQTEIKIAAIFSLTGSDAANNLRGLNGTRLAVKEINQKGGILGKKIFLQLYDDESSAAGAKECAKKAVEDSVLAILGCTYSKMALAAAPVAQNAGIPLITHIATNSSITQTGDNIFSACFNNQHQSRLLAKFVLANLKIKDAAVLFLENDQYSTDLKDDFITAFKAGGGKIVADIGFKNDDTDFEIPLNRIKKLQPSVLFIPAYISQSGMICKQAVKMDIKSIFLGADGWDDGIFNYSGNNITDSYFIDHWDQDVNNQDSKNFCAAYASEYGSVTAPNSNSALAYDAVYLLASAIKEAGSFRRNLVRDKLQSIKFPGITGEISFDQHRNPTKQAVIKKISNDTINYYKSIKL